MAEVDETVENQELALINKKIIRRFHYIGDFATEGLSQRVSDNTESSINPAKYTTAAGLTH